MKNFDLNNPAKALMLHTSADLSQWASHIVVLLLNEAGFNICIYVLPQIHNDTKFYTAFKISNPFHVSGRAVCAALFPAVAHSLAHSLSLSLSVFKLELPKMTLS